MKAVVLKADLLRTLIVGSRSILAKANLPILSNILLSAGGSKLEVVTTNLETAVKASTECRVDSEGKVTVPGKVFLEYVSQLPDGDITLEKLGEEAVVSTKGYSARFATLPTEEFPAIPKISGGKVVGVDGQKFVDSVTKVSFAAAQDESRPILSGVLCEFQKKGLVMVATDGYRLSYDETAVEANEGLAGLGMVIPAKAVAEASKIIGEAGGGGGKVSIVIADNLSQVNLKIGDVEFTSRLIEGEFPAWQKIIPTNFGSRAIASKQDFINVVRTASIFARESGSIVKLKLESGKNGQGNLGLSAATAQVGSGDAQIAVQLEGKGGEIAFNFRYLLEALSVINSDEVVFEMNESLNPGKITSVDPKDKFFHIVMPVRLQG